MPRRIMQLDSWYEDLEVVAECWRLLIVRDALLHSGCSVLRTGRSSFECPYSLRRESLRSGAVRHPDSF
jgi:hypothetical protein